MEYPAYHCPICGAKCDSEEEAKEHCKEKLADDDQSGFYIPK